MSQRPEGVKFGKFRFSVARRLTVFAIWFVVDAEFFFENRSTSVFCEMNVIVESLASPSIRRIELMSSPFPRRTCRRVQVDGLGF